MTNREMLDAMSKGLVSHHWYVDCPKCSHRHHFGDDERAARIESKRIIENGGCSKCRHSEAYTFTKSLRDDQ